MEGAGSLKLNDPAPSEFSGVGRSRSLGNSVGSRGRLDDSVSPRDGLSGLIPEDFMFRLASRARLVAVGCAFASSVAAQSPPSTPSIADDPDVQGAQRLFSAWLEGQIAYRGLPGIVVGVVADQQLVWATGFGY